MTAWPLVPLGEILIEQKGRVGSIDADGLPLLGVNNKDGLHRSGMPRISDMSRYLRVERNWFAYNPMRVNVGSIGWAHTESLAGIISPDYVVFSCTPNIEPGLLYWFLTSDTGLRAINRQTAGSVRERLYFASLARVAMPLPSIAEQRGLVNRIQQLADMHSEVIRLRQQTEDELEALCRSILFSNRGSGLVKMADLLKLRQPDTLVERHNSYSFAGVYCFGKGVFKGQTKNGTEFAYDRLTKIRAGEFTYPKLMAWEGALGIVPESCDGRFVSPEYPVFTVDTERVLPEVLDVYYRTPSVWPILGEASTGTNVRRRRLHPTAFLKICMPVPPMAIQVEIRRVRRAFEAVHVIRRSSETEVKSLLASTLNELFHFGLSEAERTSVRISGAQWGEQGVVKG